MAELTRVVFGDLARVEPCGFPARAVRLYLRWLVMMADWIVGDVVGPGDRLGEVQCASCAGQLCFCWLPCRMQNTLPAAFPQVGRV